MKGFWTLKFHTTERPRHRASHVAQLPYLRSRLKAQGWRRRAAQRCGGQLCAGSRTTLLLPVSLLYEKTRTQSGTGVSVYACTDTRWRKTRVREIEKGRKSTNEKICQKFKQREKRRRIGAAVGHQNLSQHGYVWTIASFQPKLYASSIQMWYLHLPGKRPTLWHRIRI